MAKLNRMRLSEFKNYIFLLSLPLILLSGLLLYMPSAFFYLNLSGNTAAASGGLATDHIAGINASHLPVRITAFSLFFFTLVLLNIRNNPGSNRELFLWMSLYMLGIAGLLSWGWYSGILNLFSIPFAVYFIIVFIFLFLYASRNMIVRE
jgi:hypothetical protein